MAIKFDANIKLDISIIVTSTVTIMMMISLFQDKNTNEEVQEIGPAVDEIPEEVNKLTRSDLSRIFDKLNAEANRTILTDAQQNTLMKQILREVR